ncbi:DUF4304 domain-containing protein [Kibdelosporangium lantanae]|uniref:DUF4304 domain-containing protein n=1 Tax=Kibdelosporangium lantanae TaxID=1497396 RepID=A0ABW3MA65_9PSEU
MTAQTIYARLVKDTLSPALREVGFKGSGGRYSLPWAECWAQLAFQKSAYSDAAEVRSTLNLQVVNKSDWTAARADRPHLPVRPAPSTFYGDPAVQVRIGQLTADSADKWWRINSDVDVAAVATDVIHDVREHAMPWFDQQMRERRC